MADEWHSGLVGLKKSQAHERDGPVTDRKTSGKEPLSFALYERFSAWMFGCAVNGGGVGGAGETAWLLRYDYLAAPTDINCIQLTGVVYQLCVRGNKQK